jgi:hypothetical protein
VETVKWPFPNALHSKHAVAPEAAAYEFCGHAVQPVAPLLPSYWPAAHAVQLAAPVAE